MPESTGTSGRAHHHRNAPHHGPGPLAAIAVGGALGTLARYAVAAPASTGDFDNAGIRHTMVASNVAAVFRGAGLNYGLDAGVMIQHNVAVSTPSGPDAALTAFNHAYGASLPVKPVG